MGMIELAVRIPIQLTPGQARLLLIAGAALLAALLVGAVLEAVFGGVVATILRLTGHPPPRKSTFGMALDDLDERLSRKRK